MKSPLEVGVAGSNTDLKSRAPDVEMLPIAPSKRLFSGPGKGFESSEKIDALRRQISRSWSKRMRAGALVELRHGGPQRFFLVHDGVGETLLYLNLARRIPKDFAVLAIEPRRIAGVPLAHATIEEMAAFYVEEVRRHQPHGPYRVGGLCAGGVIAYEMAVQLIDAGESVELLVLLESASPAASAKQGLLTEQRLGRFKETISHARESTTNPWKRLALVVPVLSRRLVRGLLWEISQPTKEWWVRVRFRLLREVLRRDAAWPKLVPSLSVNEIFTSAHAGYVPKSLSIPHVLLVRAQKGEGDDAPYRELYADETFGWDALVPRLKIVDVDGGHSSMLHEAFVDSLAAALMPYLRPNLGQTLTSQ